MNRASRLRAVTGVAAASVWILLAGSSPATAGVGLFIEYGRAMTTSGGNLGTVTDFANLAAPGFNFGDLLLDALDRNEVGVGIAFDSNLARDQLTNVRFDLGFHTSLFANPGTKAFLGNGYGAVFDFALGFGVLRNESMRLWVGPDVRFNIDYYGSGGLAGLGQSGIVPVATDALDLQLGVGPRIGLNLHTGDRATVTLSTVYNYKWDWSVFPSLSGVGSLSHRDHYVGVNLAFFWRGGNDSFGQ